MSTQQPEWELVGNLGDVNPIEYGGYFVYKDKTGVYSPEAEVLEIAHHDEDDDPIEWVVYRFCLDKCKRIEENRTVYLVPDAYDSTWSHPIASYDEWFHKHLEEISSYLDIYIEDLYNQFCSDDPIQLALAYQNLGYYFGFHELDSYPLFLKKSEVEERYKEFV